MAYTQADLDALDAAIATNELEVEYDGSRTRFRSIAELISARAHVSTVLSLQGANATGGRRGAWRFTPTTSRGD